MKTNQNLKEKDDPINQIPIQFFATIVFLVDSDDIVVAKFEQQSTAASLFIIAITSSTFDQSNIPSR